MIQPAGGFGFAEEALLDRFDLAILELGRQIQGLDGHDAIDLGVVSEIHGAHGSTAEFAVDLVTAQGRLLGGAVDDERASG